MGYYLGISLFAIYIALSLCIIYKQFSRISNLETENKLLKKLKPRDLWLIKERIKLMEAREFEEFVYSLFKCFDYKYVELTDATNDGGVDIIATDKNDIVTFIECKHWKDSEMADDGMFTKVSRPIAMKLRGAMDYGKFGIKPADKGILITTSEFTDNCIKYCNKMNIQCMDLDDLMEIVKQVGTEKVYDACKINRDGLICN